MKARKARDIKRVLLQKRFALNPTKHHHEYYYLLVAGVHVFTYFSHGLTEYEALMSRMKKQLKFQHTNDAENFFDCPLSGADYVAMLKRQGEL